MNQRRPSGLLLASLLLLTVGSAPVLATPAAAPSAGFQLAAASAASTAQGLALLRQGRFAEARQLAAAALDKAPDSLEANLMMGQVLDHLGEFDEALTHFKRAAEANPDSLEAQVWLGAGLLAVEQYDQAIAASEKAIATWEKKAADKELLSRLWVNLAGAQGLKSKREGLFAMLRYGTAVRGNLQKANAIHVNPRAQYALGRYYVEAPGAVGGDPAKGLPLISEALKAEPHYHVIRAHHIRALLASGQQAEAQEQWRRFTSEFADYPGVMRSVKDLEGKF